MSAPERWVRRAWRDEAAWPTAAALGALAAVYRSGVALREALYAAGALRARALPCPVVSVGNLTLGGSGKTPLALLVAARLREMGLVPALLSRGYGRRSRGVLIVADSRGVRVDAGDGGDEPVMMAERLPGVPVVVGESRYEAGRAAIERCGAGALVLDDGFQHRTLVKDLEIVAVSGRSPWGNGRLFPRGVLREPVAALARADLVVVTDPPDAGAVDRVAARLTRVGSRAALLAGRTEPAAVRETSRARVEPPAALGGRRLLAFAGLAAPEGFFETLRSLGAGPAAAVEFPDHHVYTRADLEALAGRAREAGAEGLVTTEKDWVRLRALGAPPLPLWVLGVSMRLEDRERLEDALRRAVDRAGAR